MNHNKPLPGSRPFLVVGSIIGFWRAVIEFGNEAGAPKEEIAPETRVEPDDLNVKVLWMIGVGLLLTIWAIVVVLYPLFHYFTYVRTGGRDPAQVLAYVPELPPKPRNEHAPFETLEKFQKREQGDLNSYRWVDRKKGIVSIPISRAMQIVAQHGVPARPPSNIFYVPPKAASLGTGFERKVEPEAW